MCGIAGIVLARPIEPDVLRARLTAMIRMLRHRGPDAEAVWADRHAGLAHARLSVVDLSPAAGQPMSDAGEHVWLTFNGEIYNFRTLRAELEAKGHRFRSHADSEVIIHGYKQWGDDVVHRLRGMFAFAIWDAHTRHLLLARDRLGKKPLYYADTPDGLLFGSELKAIVAWPGVPRTPNLTAIHHYLSLQYVPAPLTAFDGIQALPPAHVLRLDVHDEGGRASCHVSKYWSLPRPAPARASAQASTQRQIEEELVARLDEAVRLRMSADVPIGAFLSGGVDSSAVVALMAAGGGRVKTFSVGFAQPDYDESAFARGVSERFGTEHHALTVGPESADLLPQLAWQYDEPFADSSAVPTFCLAAFARRHVTVALCGDGGDEAFMGYTRYAWVSRTARLVQIPRALRLIAAAIGDALPGTNRFSRRMARLTTDLRAANAMSPDLYEAVITLFTHRNKQEAYGPVLREYLDRPSTAIFAPYFAESSDLVSAANWADLHTYLPGDLLVKVDRATMAHGLECRSPFLDHELMEWAVGLGLETRLRGGALKGLLKHALTGRLPQPVLDRPKMGFGCPVDHWLRREWKEMSSGLLLSTSFDRRGLISRAYVERLLREHASGADNHGSRLWTLIMLELWFQTWIDGAPNRRAA